VTGPSVVAIGGGHGLSASLRAIRRHAGSVTAVVSVADDGGSSGRLRSAMPSMPAPGDVRRCLGALAEEDTPFGRILEHRFADGELEGHALGNLLLVALTAELGSFAAAVDVLADRVGAVGRVLPATVGPVSLQALRADARRSVDEPVEDRAGEPVSLVTGQAAVQRASGVFHIRLQPEDAVSPPEVPAAIEAADQVVIGPGSLFTSVLAAAIAPDVRAALQATAAPRVYVANLFPEVPETAGFTVADELVALAAHRIPVDVVVVDPRRALGPVAGDVRVVTATVADARLAVHVPELLGPVLADLSATTSRRSAPAPL
jgi:uncharacterized cofD-like protein